MCVCVCVCVCVFARARVSVRVCVCVCVPEEKRLREEEVEKLEALTVKDLHLHIRGNAFEHNTLKFECTKGDNAQPVLRRGQEFNVTIIFNRAYQKDKDDLIFMLDAGTSVKIRGSAVCSK